MLIAKFRESGVDLKNPTVKENTLMKLSELVLEYMKAMYLTPSFKRGLGHLLDNI